MSARTAVPRSTVRSPTARATVLVLWQAAPWVLTVLVALTVLFGAISAARAWFDPYQQAATTLVDGGAGFTAFFLTVAVVVSWERAVHVSVPALVAGGLTRATVVRAVVVGVAALALACTAVLTAVALVGAAVSRALAAASTVPAVVAARAGPASDRAPSSPAGGDAWSSPLTWLAALLVLGLAGAVLGAARYRWGARGVVVTVVLLVAANTWLVDRLVLAPGDGAAVSWPGVAGNVAVVLALAASLWLVLRRAPLNPPAR